MNGVDAACRLTGAGEGTMIWIWLAFITFVLAMLALDLGVFHRHAHTVSMKEALVTR